jgi:NADPH-dependent curcumin reductase CurA
MRMIYEGLTIRGFTVSHYVDRFNDFYAEVPQLVQQGKIRFDETKYEGFDKIPEAFAGLFLGHNSGKAVVTVE